MKLNLSPSDALRVARLKKITEENDRILRLYGRLSQSDPGVCLMRGRFATSLLTAGFPPPTHSVHSFVPPSDWKFPITRTIAVWSGYTFSRASAVFPLRPTATTHM